ncbi:thermonuclease family protein [Bacillus sp. 31A1R]|uniref:Thermonuclease family protein n=1 Tax=Robertmurraya mangrovi TaxID=3098077 RepID=A0ABU5IXM8_9BACI|nr:thermonuclease family protein [Bacillus sp. 31A1R]MDZ5471876.1 thermonuclease family protein [Bacillus sp. 31A1R]
MKKLHTTLIIFVTFLIVSILILPNLSEAHSGRLDKLGGHFRTSDCVYELHKPTTLAKKAKTKSEIVTMIKKYSSNKCKNNLTTSKLSLQGYNLGTGTTVTKGKLALNKKYTATLSKCTDGDTANFKVDGKIYKTRFLYIDTPEYTTKKEKYGKEASEYTCSKLKKAKKLVLETDGKDVYDKYDRLLAWVWIDGKLHQEMITKAGLVEGFYDYGTYDYEKKVKDAMSYAMKNKKGMYK